MAIILPKSIVEKILREQQMRTAQINRSTSETSISVEINLDGSGQFEIETGVGFFDHMLEQLARHSLIDISITAKGDLHIDDHHCTEDVGIVLGDALATAIGDKRGITRYGFCCLPMDDAWVDVTLDFSGRPFLSWNIDFPVEKVGGFDTDLIREFYQALSSRSGITLHADLRNGFNSHHIAEATFKSFARALRMAVKFEDRSTESIPSTKNVL